MKNRKDDERRRLVAESSQKQLADGTWPAVMMVFGYFNPSATRTLDSKFDLLRKFYERAKCTNMVVFLDMVRFSEAEHATTVSFNFSMCWRLVRGKIPEFTAKNAAYFMSTPDILVGSRGGPIGAAFWLKKFTETMPSLAPESIQVMDKIFGEANRFLVGPSRTMTITDMFKYAVGEGEALKPPNVRKH